MYFAVHILPPAQRQRNPENAIRTVPVPIEGDKTFADLLRGAQARFEAISSPMKKELRFDTLADKHGAEMFASDKIESLFGTGQTGMELFLYTSDAFKVPPKPVRTPATTKGEPAFKRRRLAPPTPDSNAEVPTEEPAEDPIEDFDEYELPASSERNAFTELTSSQRKGAAPTDWRPEEDRVVLKGMQQGWSAKKVLSQLPNSHRTESAVRGRRAVLKRKHPDQASRSPVATPSTREVRSWSDDELAKLRLGRAGGLDSHAIHERYFARGGRSLEAVTQKLRRMEDLGAIPGSSAPPRSTQPESSPAEAALARRQSPPQVEPVMRTAYVQLPAREEVAAQMETQAVVAPPRVHLPTKQEGIFRNQPESERWRICMQKADGDEEKARRYREDLQSDMDMINAVAKEDQHEIENIKARRIQARLRRAVADGRARRKKRRTPRSGTLVPSTETADDDLLRDSDWEVLEEEDIADMDDDMMNFGDEEPGNDDQSSVDEAEDMIRDRKIEEVEDEEPTNDNEDSEDKAASDAQDRKIEEVKENGAEEDSSDSSDSDSDSEDADEEEDDEDEDDDQARNDLELLETQLVAATPVMAEAPSSNAIPESEQFVDDSAMSVRTDESKSKVSPSERREPVKPDLEQRARRRSRTNTITARAGAPRSRSRTDSIQSKSDATPDETLADDKAPQTAGTPSTSTTTKSTPGKLPTLRQRMQVKPEARTPAKSVKARPSAYDIPTSEPKARSSPPRLEATSAFVGTLSREREELLKNKDWMPPPPKRRDPDELLPKRKANGDPLWFESDDEAGSDSSSDSD